MLAMSVCSAHWHPDTRAAPEAPTPAPALLAGARSRSRQLLVILRLIHHLPCLPPLLHEGKERREGARRKCTEKVPPLSGILHTQGPERRCRAGLHLRWHRLQGSVLLPRLSPGLHPWLPLPPFPSKLSLGPVPFWRVTEHPPHHLTTCTLAAAWVLVNYTGSVITPDGGPQL